jgi:hypothetical protein
VATVLHADRDVAVVAEHRTPPASRASLLPGTGYGGLAPGPVKALDGKLFASDWLSEQTTSVNHPDLNGQ